MEVGIHGSVGGSVSENDNVAGEPDGESRGDGGVGWLERVNPLCPYVPYPSAKTSGLTWRIAACSMPAALPHDKWRKCGIQIANTELPMPDPSSTLKVLFSRITFRPCIPQNSISGRLHPTNCQSKAKIRLSFSRLTHNINGFP